jgi:hypothetical protein
MIPGERGVFFGSFGLGLLLGLSLFLAIGNDEFFFPFVKRGRKEGREGFFFLMMG